MKTRKQFVWVIRHISTKAYYPVGGNWVAELDDIECANVFDSEFDAMITLSAFTSPQYWEVVKCLSGELRKPILPALVLS